jgi:Cdc6-like AAA superfamily ATPase
VNGDLSLAQAALAYFLNVSAPVISSHDDLGMICSIPELLTLAGIVVNYIREVKDAPEERGKILLEICSIVGFLYHLNDVIERVDEGTTTKWLGSPDGPLAQFKSVLEDLVEKFTRIKKAGKALSWPFQKGGVAEILQTIERLKTLFSLVLLKDHNEDVRETKRELTVFHHRFLAQESRDIINWLSSLNCWTTQNDTFNKRIDGTGEWLLEHGEFNKWLDGTHTLWCHGMPGAGKTVLASVIINFLNTKFKSNDIGVAFLYCSYKEQTKQTPLNLIAHLLQQFLVRRSAVPDELRSLYNSHINKISRPSLKECSKMLHREVGRFSKTFIIIDALDEYTERDGAKDTFLNELRQLHPNVRLLVTSRNMCPSAWDFKIEHLEIRASDDDVGRYVKYRISESSQLAGFVKKCPSLEDEMVTTIVEKAKGMFLLARLHMNSLAGRLHMRALRNALGNLSQEIGSTYDEVMQRIESQDEDRVGTGT